MGSRTYRLTRPQRYSPGQPGHNDVCCRQGYYDDASSVAEVLCKMQARYPDETVWDVQSERPWGRRDWTRWELVGGSWSQTWPPAAGSAVVESRCPLCDGHIPIDNVRQIAAYHADEIEGVSRG